MPVILSRRADGAGPIPRHVMVPGGISVSPLSTISAYGRLDSFASFSSFRSSSSDFAFRAILHCPSSSQASNHSWCFFLVCSAAVMAAWLAWAAVFPLLIFRSVRMIMACLYLNSDMADQLFQLG